MMSKFSTRSISLSLRCSRKGLPLVSTPRTAFAVASVRAASTSRLTPLFGVSSHYINRLQYVQDSSNKQLYRMYASGLPDHRLIGMPALSPTMEHGTIVNWQKKEGDEVAEGDLVCEIETDKSVMAFEASEEGFLAKILVPAGTKGIKIGKPICVFVDNKEDCGAFANFKPEGVEYAAAAPAPAAPAAAAPAAAAAGGSFPEHVEVPFPALSPTMSTGKVVTWHKKVGEEIAEGDLICDIETDKSVIGFEMTEEGFLAKIILPEGTAGVPVGQPLCVICKNKDDVAAFANYVPTAGAPAAAPPPAPAPAPAPSVSAAAPAPAPVQALPTARVPPAPRAPGARVIASPYARKLAAEMGVDLSSVTGTGPSGRIIAADVQGAEPSEAAAEAEAPGEELVEEAFAGPKRPAKKRAVPGDPKYKDIPLSNMRETIAKRLSKSKQDVPHYYLTSEVNVDELLKMRKKLNEDLKEQGVKVSVNDFIVKAAALACLDVPEANSYFMDKEKVIRQNLTVDVSVAVKTKTGLITPIVHNADAKGLAEISAEVKQLADKANKNKLQPQEYMGGTFTVSNLGMFGSIHHFTAIINPPQSCILAVGGAEQKVVPDGEKGFKTVTTMFVTMSCDHRVVDGAIGATWLKHFKDYIEKPEMMLL